MSKIDKQGVQGYLASSAELLFARYFDIEADPVYSDDGWFEKHFIIPLDIMDSTIEIDAYIHVDIINNHTNGLLDICGYMGFLTPYEQSGWDKHHWASTMLFDIEKLSFWQLDFRYKNNKISSDNSRQWFNFGPRYDEIVEQFIADLYTNLYHNRAWAFERSAAPSR